jgi:hypothetical protein
VLGRFEVDELRASTPINSFRVGPKVGVSADAPWTDSAYPRHRGWNKDPDAQLHYETDEALLPADGWHRLSLLCGRRLWRPVSV